ncbi:MAG: DUF3168 domain-containing protein [Arhodomonas sp.]|nr:DUF3168 domain-containing protein [Arhodomonas sp.]
MGAHPLTHGDADGFFLRRPGGGCRRRRGGGRPHLCGVVPAEDPQPYVTLQLVSDVPQYHLGGNSGTWLARVQLDIWTLTTADRQSARTAVLALLDFYRGDLGAAGLDVRRITVDDISDSTEQRKDEAPIYRTRIDFLAWYTTP